VAVATVLFPRLARLAARADMGDFRHTLSLGLRQIGFLLIPASVVSAVLAHPIIRLLYERGDFEPDQTPVVANALAAFSLGLAFNGAMLMLNRAFFSLQAPWPPTLIALANLLLNTALNFALYPVGTWGLPLATSIANIAGVAALLLVLRRRLRRLELGETANSAIRIALASLPLAAGSYAVWRGLDEALGRTLPAELVSVGTALVAGLAIYLISCRLLRVRELEALLTLRSRFRRA
jgi:putative peptidoglycan lipid II flippase